MAVLYILLPNLCVWSIAPLASFHCLRIVSFISFNTFTSGASDDAFFVLIENLILKQYGEWKTELVMWYVYDRFNENEELMPLMIQEEGKEEDEEVFIESPEQLWDLIKKLEKKSKK